MKYIWISMLAGLSLFLSACSVSPAVESGNKKLSIMTEQELGALLQKGKEIQDEVRKILGEPERVSNSNNGTQWSYYYQCKRNGGPLLYDYALPIVGGFISRAIPACEGKERKLDLSIVFNLQGTVDSYEYLLC